MESDIKLINDGTVEITGEKLNATVNTFEIGGRSSGKFKGFSLNNVGEAVCRSYSFCVLNPDIADSQPRTALAQSPNDELVINANGHYKGGVTIDSPVLMTGDITVQKTLIMNVGSKILIQQPRRFATKPADRFTTEHGGKEIIIAESLPTIDLLEKIDNLQETIKELQKKVGRLEVKIGEKPHE